MNRRGKKIVIILVEKGNENPIAMFRPLLKVTTMLIKRFTRITKQYSVSWLYKLVLSDQYVSQRPL